MVIKIALAGNPNSGKTTLFNKLTGSSQRTGNWTGVTVERKEGNLRKKDDVVIVDLPGIYSLSPYSPEEVVSRDFLLNERPDAVINIVDASNLERNLYLTTQILTLGIPTVIALNMMDVATKNGITIDIEKLSKDLGCEIVGTTALKGDGVDELMDTAVSVIGRNHSTGLRHSKEFERFISKTEECIRGKVPDDTLRWYALKLLERDIMAGEKMDNGTLTEVESVVSAMEEEMDGDADSIIAEKRYELIGKIVNDSVDKGRIKNKGTTSDRIDRVVTNRWLGIPIFLLTMFAVYFIAIETIGGWATDSLNGYIEETVMPSAREWLAGAGVADWLIGLIVDGIIAGVGAVIGFLPQMLVLFLVLVILEECGYMARVAFIMDHIFRKFGLSGKSFISVLIGMGCGVPGIMASRTIEGKRERKITSMIVTFIPCSAKLPVIAMIAGALFGGSALIAVSIYVLGIACILISGIMMKKWRSLAGTPSPFIMELPRYHIPYFVTVIKAVLGRGWAFVKKAGTFVLLACVAVWIMSTFDWGLHMADTGDSMMAGIGNVLRYIFVPLGFGDDWEFTTATLTGLLAKENVVGTMGVLMGSGDEGEGLWNIIGNTLTPAAGYSFLVFNMICAPCVAAMGAMRAELGSWREAGKAIAYQCVLAYAVSLIVYQFGGLFLGDGLGWGMVPAAAVLAAMAYILIAKEPFKIFRRGPDAV